MRRIYKGATLADCLAQLRADGIRMWQIRTSERTEHGHRVEVVG